jgi:hypothetical protein
MVSGNERLTRNRGGVGRDDGGGGDGGAVDARGMFVIVGEGLMVL